MKLELRPRPGWAVAAGFVALVVVGAIAGLFIRSDTASSRTETSISRQFTVNGHQLYLTCQGSGSPTVVLDAGLGDGHSVDSNHGVPASQPGLVRAAIDLVVRAARDGQRLPACAALTLPPLGATC